MNAAAWHTAGGRALRKKRAAPWGVLGMMY
jgi:hypothetical protein